MSESPETAGTAPFGPHAGGTAPGNTEVPPGVPTPMVTLPVSEYDALRNLAAQAEAAYRQADEYLAAAKYAKADFINYQDRVRKDKADWNRIALTQFASDLVSAMDGLGLANFEDPKLNDALRILEKEFVRVLGKHGITPIDTAGQQFDPMLHDAIAMEPQGTKLQEARRGWMIDGKVLRAASVRIVKE